MTEEDKLKKAYFSGADSAYTICEGYLTALLKHIETLSKNSDVKLAVATTTKAIIKKIDGTRNLIEKDKEVSK